MPADTPSFFYGAAYGAGLVVLAVALGGQLQGIGLAAGLFITTGSWLVLQDRRQAASKTQEDKEGP